MKVKQNLQIVGACNITSNNMSISILSARLDTVLQNLQGSTMSTIQENTQIFQEHLSSEEFLQGTKTSQHSKYFNYLQDL